MKKFLLPVFYLFYTSVIAQTGNITDTLIFQNPNANQQISIGYDQVGFETLTLPVTRRTANQLNQGIIYDWNQLWQGRVPGLLVARPGGNIHNTYDMRVRGLHTFNGNAAPLFVLDGIPGVSPQSIDPADIASMEVLRGAAASAIYGGRGSSGVILLHSKAPQKGFHATYTAQFGIDNAARRHQVMTSSEFISFGGVDQFPNEDFETDWQSEVLTRAFSHAHHLNLSNGWGRNGFVRANLHYRNQEGTLKPMNFQQLNGDITASQGFLNDKIRLVTGASLYSRDANIGIEEAYRFAVTANPTLPVKSNDLRFSQYDGYTELDLFDYFNPVALIEQQQQLSKTVGQLLYARGSVDLLKGFGLTATVAQDRFGQDQGTYNFPKAKYQFYTGNSIVERQNSKRSMFEVEAHAQRQISKLSLVGTLGYGWQRQQSDYHDYWGRVDASQTIDLLGLGGFTDYVLLQDSAAFGLGNFRDQSADLISAFGRLSATWDDAVFLQLAARRDGSGALGVDGRWGLFPSVSLGVNLARWTGQTFINVLKPRIAWGESGMAPNVSGLSKYAYARNQTFYYNGVYRPSLAQIRNQNDALTWERSEDTNIGLDIALMDSKLTASFDWFRMESRDLIENRTVQSPPAASNKTWENWFTLKGSGIELDLNYAAIQNNNLEWNIGLNAAHYKQTFESWQNGTVLVASKESPGGCCGYFHWYQNGDRLGELTGLTFTGIDNFGSAVYKDYNNDGIVDDSQEADQVVIGQGIPNWEIGLQQQVKTGRWTFAMAFRSVLGHNLVNTPRLYYESTDPTRISWNRIKTDYFDPALRSNTRISDRYAEKASFTRVQYLSAAYQFKLNNAFIKAIDLQVGASNPITITQYSGLDPEVRLSDRSARSTSANLYSAGIDRYHTTPPIRGYWLGITARF